MAIGKNIHVMPDTNGRCMVESRQSNTWATAGLRTILAIFSIFAMSAISRESFATDPDFFNDPRVDPRVKALVAQSRGISDQTASPLAFNSAPVSIDDRIDLIVQGMVDRSELEALGAHVQTQAGRVTTIQVNLGAVESLIGVSGLEYLRDPDAVEFQSNVSLPIINAPTVWGGPPPNFGAAGYTGQNVVIGIVDTGIDVTHADFKTSSNQTRILSIWDQTITGAPPAGYTYGSEFSSAQINAGSYGGTDLEGHGTHIAGVAGGNGRATGNGVPMYTYMGTAPEANYVVVRLSAINGSYPDSRIIDGVAYIFNRAQALGKPAVVLLAIGKMNGPHDGSDFLDTAISNLTGPRKIVVAAGGNFRGQSRHAEWTSTGANQTGNLTVNIPAFNASPIAADNFQSEAWYDNNANYSVSVVTPGGTVVGPVPRGSNLTTQTLQGLVEIRNGQYTSLNGSYRVNLNVFRASPTVPLIAAGTWTYRFHSQTSGTHKVDCWITTYQVGAAKPTFVQGMTERVLVTSPGTGTNVVAVSAFSTKRSWIDVNGTTRTYFYAAVNDIADFSSPGPRRDGSSALTIASPGYGVVGSLSAQSQPSDTYIMQDGKHRILQGTSVSAAHVAGGVALLLEQNPNLTPAQVKTQLQSWGIRDTYTGAVPNNDWGSGKLYLQTTTQSGVGEVDPIVARFRFSASPNPTTGPAHFRFTLEASDVKENEIVQLRIIDVSGRQVALLKGKAAAGEQALVWNGELSDGSQAAPGVYMGRLEVGESRAAQKVVKLR